MSDPHRNSATDPCRFCDGNPNTTRMCARCRRAYDYGALYCERDTIAAVVVWLRDAHIADLLIAKGHKPGGTISALEIVDTAADAIERGDWRRK